MSAFTTLTLDTTAPAVVVNSVTGAIVGQTVSIDYSTDEPLVLPELVLFDGTVLALADDGSTLSVDLPLSAAGPALLRWGDDVGNVGSIADALVVATGDTTAVTYLTLDTTAPTVAVTGSAGTNAGDYLRLGYTTDEPLATASLRLSDARVLALAISPSELAVLLPPDTADGPATLLWTDAVGNPGQIVNAVVLSGVVGIPPAEPPTGGMPAPARRTLRRRLRARVTFTVETTSSTRREQTHRGHLSFTVTTSAAAVARRAPALVEVAVTVVGRPSNTYHAMTPIDTTVTASVRRRDDPTIEAFLLGLN
jgi:hypothetical protein